MDDFPGNDALLQRIRRAIWTELSGGRATILVEGDQFLDLDPVALRIWSLLAEPVSVEGIVGVLVEEYDVGLDECRTGVRATVELFWQHGQVSAA